MKIVGLDGKEYRLKGERREPGDTRPRSAGHLRARSLLNELFGLEPIWEEVFLPGCKGALYLDFFLPRRMLAIEVQGAQHFTCVAHFHGGVAGFRKQRERDARKREFCEVNGIRLVELKDGESDGEWRGRLEEV
jgi:hypothetical protein